MTAETIIQTTTGTNWLAEAVKDINSVTTTGWTEVPGQATSTVETKWLEVAIDNINGSSLFATQEPISITSINPGLVGTETETVIDSPPTQPTNLVNYRKEKEKKATTKDKVKERKQNNRRRKKEKKPPKVRKPDK